MTSLAAAAVPAKPKLSRSHKSKPKVSLISKLAQACALVEMVEKKGMNSKFGDYLRASDVLRALRGHLFAVNVLIVPDDDRAEWANVETPEGLMRECTLHTAFVVEDGDSGEKRTFKAIGIARLPDEKALYAAKTGALKFFLKGLGLIVDEEADPEYDAAALEPKVFIGKIYDMRKTCLTIQPAAGEPVKVKVEDEATRNRLFDNRKEDVRAECQLQVNKYGKQYWLLKDVLIGKFQVAKANQPELGAVLEASAEQQALINTLKRSGAEHGVPEEAYLRHIVERYAVPDIRQLTAGELTDVINWIFENRRRGPQPVAEILDAEPEEITGD